MGGGADRREAPYVGRERPLPDRLAQRVGAGRRPRGGRQARLGGVVPEYVAAGGRLTRDRVPRRPWELAVDARGLRLLQRDRWRGEGFDRRPARPPPRGLDSQAAR